MQARLDFLSVIRIRIRLDFLSVGGFVLGTERFQKEIAATLGRRTWRGIPGRPIKADGEAKQEELEL